MKKLSLLLAAIVALAAGNAAAEETRPIYLMVAPHDLYDSLNWYIGERAKAHQEVEFAIVDTKTQIYDVADYDFRKSGSSRCRNAAESIHKYLRQYYKDHPTLKYVVLGGVWYDATDFKGKGQVYFQNDNSPVTLDNAIPGIFCPFLSSLGGAYPTDMFYGCLEEKGTYPWDANGDGQYMGEEECREKQVDVLPDVAVARLSFIPRPEFKHADGTMLNQHEMITNFVRKLQRAEAPDFAGRAKYGTEGSWVIGSDPNSAGNMDRQEFEFYDFAPNMGDPRSANKHGDEEAMSRRDLKGIAEKHPILQCKTLNDSAKTARGKTYENVSTDFFHSDMDYAWVYSHGWALGGSYFSANAFSSHNGLLKFFNACIPCETGMVDYYQSSNGKTYINWCLGSSGLMSPNGGFLASVCNSRYGMDGENAVNGLKWFMDQHYAHKHEPAGEAWLNAIRDQHNKYFGKAPWMVQRNYAILMFHGDPLVKMADEKDATIPGPTWNELQVVKNATISSTSLTFDKQVAMMSAALTGSGELSISGAKPHEFRVMDYLTAPAGADLTIAAMGGVGKGVVFSDGEKGKLTLDTPDYFYLGGLENASELALTGHGAVVEAGELKNVEAITFNGKERTGAPNILRSRTKGALKSFPTLALKDTAVELQTYEPFEGATSPSISLDNADLIVGQNPFWGLSGYGQTLPGNLSLANGSKLTAKTTKEVLLDTMSITSTGANNALMSASGGVFCLKGTTTVAIAPGTTFTVNAEFKDVGSGKLVFVSPNATAANPAKVDLANAKLAGAIELGENVLLADPTVITYTPGMVLQLGKKYFFPNQAESPCVVNVSGNVTLGSSFFANSTTEYVFRGANDNASLTASSLAIVGATRFELPLTVQTLSVSGEFGCTKTLTCPDVVIEQGGTLRLQGEPAPTTKIVLRDGAIVKPVMTTKTTLDIYDRPVVSDAIDQLVLNDGVGFTFEGGVLLDASAVQEMLAKDPDYAHDIISGEGRMWTIADFAHIAVQNHEAVLGTDMWLGSLQIASASGLIKGPYAADAMTDEFVWGEATWTGAEEKTFSWTSVKLDYGATGTLTVRNAADTTIIADEYVALQTLTFLQGEGLSPNVTFVSDWVVEVPDLDFSALTGSVMIKGPITGRIHTAPRTTIHSVTGATLLLHSGDSVTIDDLDECELTIDPASTGALYVRDTALLANKMTLFDMAEAPLSGFYVYAINEAGDVNEAVEFYYDAERKKLCSRPLGGLRATVDGSNAFTALDWQNAAGQSVTVTDWSQVEEVVLTVSGTASINLDAAPTTKINVQGSGTLTIAASGDASVKLPTVLAIDGATLKVEGDILPNLDEAKGSGSLVLATGARTNYPMTVIACPANELSGGITINEGSEFAAVFSGGMNLWDRGSWAKLKGNGKLVFASNNGTKHRVFSPRNTWGADLSFGCYVELLYPYHGSSGSLNAPTYTYGFKNLEGNAQIGIEPGGNMSRALLYYEITQTTTTTWSGIPEYIRLAGNNTGTFHQFVVKGNGSVDARLTYTGSCPTGRPIFSGNTPYPAGAATWDHTLTVDSSGVLELDGRWSGAIVNKGLVLLGPNATLAYAEGGASPLNGRIGAGSTGVCDLTRITKGDSLKYDVSVPGTIRFSVENLYSKVPVCALTDNLQPGKPIKLVAVDPKGNTAERIVTANDITTGNDWQKILNWRGPVTAPKVLFK